MVNGFALGGFAQGQKTADDILARQTQLDQGQQRIGQADEQIGLQRRQVGLQEKQFGLKERQMKADESRQSLSRADKAIGDTLNVINEFVQNSKAAGADPEAIRKTIAPLLQDVQQLAQGSGQDPARYVNSVEALVNSPLSVGNTLKQAQAGALNARSSAKTAGGSGKPLPAEVAGRLATIKVGLQNFKDLETLVKGFGETGSSQNVLSAAEHTTGLGDANKARILLRQSVEGALRALTGAAAPQTEVDRLMGTWGPTPFDRPETRELKLNLLKGTMVNMVKAIQSGRVEFIDLSDFEKELNTQLSQKQQQGKGTEIPINQNLVGQQSQAGQPINATQQTYSQAKAALAAGKKPEQVKQQLLSMGLDPRQVGL